LISRCHTNKNENRKPTSKKQKKTPLQRTLAIIFYKNQRKNYLKYVKKRRDF